MDMDNESRNQSVMRETWFSARSKKSAKDLFLPTVRISKETKQELIARYGQPGSNRDFSADRLRG